MVSGILTPETSILVAVASRNLWFTLLPQLCPLPHHQFLPQFSDQLLFLP